MDLSRATRARAWLARDDVRAHDPPAIDRLGAALEDPTLAHDLVSTGRNGTTIVFCAGARPRDRRRCVELDRDGNLVALLRWTADGALQSAAVRTAYGDWIGLEPRGAQHPAWGASDRIWRLDPVAPWRRADPLTVFEALEWSHVSHVPPLAEPARLLPGAGTAVLNVIAALAKDQAHARLAYRGPWPTEQLFVALLESFRLARSDPDPLARFFEGGLEWIPAPHERRFPQPGVCVQMRTGIEKVVLGGRTYVRAGGDGVRLHAPRRVEDTQGVTRCSLWALGAEIEHHLTLDPAGTVLEMPAIPLATGEPEEIDGPIVSGVTAVLRALSAPALAAALDDAMAALVVEWGPVTGDLVELSAGRARFSWRLADTGRRRISASVSPAERAAHALELLAEMARLLADDVRLRAQAILATRDSVAQEQALAAEPRAGDAAVIAAAAQRLGERLASTRARSSTR